MTQFPDTITLSKTVPARIADDRGSVIVGGNDLDHAGTRVLGVGIHDADGDRDLEGLAENDTFDFAGATWRVSTIYDPSPHTRGLVAELTRVT